MEGKKKQAKTPPRENGIQKVGYSKGKLAQTLQQKSSMKKETVLHLKDVRDNSIKCNA